MTRCSFTQWHAVDLDLWDGEAVLSIWRGQIEDHLGGPAFSDTGPMTLHRICPIHFCNFESIAKNLHTKGLKLNDERFILDCVSGDYSGM